MAVVGTLRGVGARTKHVMLQPLATAAGIAMIRVTGTYETLNKVAQLVGAPLGGLLVYWFGPSGAIWVDAGSFAACGLIVSALVHPPSGAAQPAREPYLAAMAGGTRQLLQDQPLMAMIACYFVMNMVNQAGAVVFWAATTLSLTAGILLAASASLAMIAATLVWYHRGGSPTRPFPMT